MKIAFKTHSILFAILFTGMPIQSYAGNLADIYALAKRQDTGLQIAIANYNASAQQHPIARASLLPQVSANVNTSDTSQKIDGQTFNVSGGDIDFNTHGYGATLTQALYHHDFYVQLRQAKNAVAKAQVELDNARQDLIVRVAQVYFDVLAAQDNVRFAEAEKKSFGRQLEQAETRFEVGLIAITDVKEAQASYDLAVSREIDANTALSLAIDALAVVTGERLEELKVLSENMQLLRPDPDDVQTWIDRALDQNLTLLASEYDTRIAAQEIKLRRSGHLPTVDIVGSYNDSDTGSLTGSRRTKTSQIGLELNLPILAGGRTYYQTKEARHLHSVALNTLESQRRETVRLTRDSFLNVVSGISRVKALGVAVESAEAAAEATQAGFDVGTRTSVDVLVALRTVFEAQRDYSRSKYDYLLNTLRLKQATGLLNADDLLQINDWLE